MTCSLCLSALPVYAVADNSELENSLKTGWSYGTSSHHWYMNNPSGYDRSFFSIFGNMFADYNEALYYQLSGSTTRRTTGNSLYNYIVSINSELIKTSSDTSSYKWYLNNHSDYLKTIRDYLGESALSNVFTNTSSAVMHLGYIRSSLDSVVSSLASFDSPANVRSWNYIDGRSTQGNIGSPISGPFIISSDNGILYNWYINSLGSYELSKLNVSNFNLSDYLYYADHALTNIHTRLFTPRTYYPLYKIDNSSQSLSKQSINAFSIADILWNMQSQLLTVAARFNYLYADNNLIERKKANEAVTSSALDNFTGSGDASASVSDFGTLKDSVSAVKSGLSSSASASDVLGVFNSSDGFGWFSQATLDSLDTTSSSVRRVKAVRASSSTPLYDSNYNSLLEYLGISND